MTANSFQTELTTASSVISQVVCASDLVQGIHWELCERQLDIECALSRVVEKSYGMLQILLILGLEIVYLSYYYQKKQNDSCLTLNHPGANTVNYRRKGVCVKLNVLGRGAKTGGPEL